MRVRLKKEIKTKKFTVAKGADGRVIAVKNDPQSFLDLSEKGDGFYYLVKFPEVESFLLSKQQFEFF